MRGLFGGRAPVGPFSGQDPRDAAARIKPPPVFSPPFNPGAPAAKPMQQPARRGLFGRIGAYLTPDRLSLIAAALGDGGSGFGDELERQRSARDSTAYQAMRMRASKYDIADAEQRRQETTRVQAARERYGARLTPEQQDEFVLDPEGTMERTRAPEYGEFGPIGGGFYGQRNARTGEYGNIAASPYARGRGAGGESLSAREEARVGAAAESATSASELGNAAREFLALNADNRRTGHVGQRTGQLANMDIWWNSERQRMQALSRFMQQRMREPGSGSASDTDMVLLQQVVPNLDRLGDANRAGALAIQQYAQQEADYASYLDDYSSRAGTLQGAESRWRMYRDANPMFDRNGSLRTSRPTFDEWVALGAPDMRNELAPGSTDGVSDAEALEEFRRRASVQDIRNARTRPRLPRAAPNENSFGRVQ